MILLMVGKKEDGHGKEEYCSMWLYQKKLQYPVNIKKKDLRMAKYIITQLGGPDGELGASLRYLSQRYTMPDNRGKALLTSIGTEEMDHAEMISVMLYQLMKDASIEELDRAGLLSYYTQHGRGIFPSDASGVPFSATFASTGDYLADLSEDMAAEEKARATYEHLINIANDKDIINPLLFLRQREIVHFARFKELYDYYKMQFKNKETNM